MCIFWWIKFSWHKTIRFFYTTIADIRWFLKFFAFGSFITRAYIDTSHIRFSTEFTNNTTLFITKANYFTSFAMNTWWVCISCIGTFFCMCMKSYFSRSFFADSSIHACLFRSLLLRLLSFDFSLCIFLAQAGQYFDMPERGTYSTPHTVQFLGFNAVHRFVGVICNSPTKPMNL